MKRSFLLRSETPQTNDFHLDSSVPNASIYYGFKSNRRNRFGNKLRSLRRRHRIVQNATKSVKSNLNPMVQPIISTTSSTHDRHRFAFDKNSSKSIDVTNFDHARRIGGFPMSFTTNFGDLREEASETIRQASSVSGYSPETCQQIIAEFTKLKQSHEENQSTDKRTYRMYPSKLRRSLSLDDL